MSLPGHGGTGNYDTPQLDGEQLVSRVRLVLALVSISLIAVYTIGTAHAVWNSLVVSGIAMFVWGLMSLLYLALLGRGIYRPFMSFISTVVDISVVTLIQVALIFVLPLNFVNGPVTSIYFVTIGLAALRKSRRLTIFAGVSSALVHLTVSGIGFKMFLPSGYLLTDVNGHPMEITYLDEIGIALCLVFVGWIIGHVTRGLRESEKHYQELFENVPDGILIASAKKRILAVNRRFSDMVGVPSQEIIGARVEDHLGHSASPNSTSASPLGLIGSPTILTRTDGIEVPVRTVAIPIEFGGEACVEMSVRDVAEQAQLERQLAQSQKMETIGRLAGGLAHDFNNILGGILGAAALARRALGKSEDHPQKERLDRQMDVILECGERAQDVVTRLLTFSRNTVIETEPLDLNGMVDDVATICSNTFGGEISVKVEDTPTPLMVQGDRTSLTQALLNLCINGKDAIESSGTVTISVSEVIPDEETIATHPDFDREEDYCRIQVSDTGTGVNASTLDKIFDPFFTTKPTGEGTGLGLFMVYNIAKQHGGFVDVETRKGEGSTFSIFLTRARDSLLPPEPEEQDLPRGSEKILVVDDDQIVRTTLKGMLAELGYDVYSATNGDEAMRMFTEAKRPFQLVVLDMVMPQIDGAETLRLIRTQSKDVKVILTSGYVDISSTMTLEELGYSDFLSKPFTFKTLAKMVRSALG